MKKIRILTKAGKMIERNAELVDHIGNDGQQFTTAMIGRILYDVIDRDFYGAVFGKRK